MQPCFKPAYPEVVGYGAPRHQSVGICLACGGGWIAAPILNVRYRRIVFGRTSDRSHAPPLPNAWQSTTLRYDGALNRYRCQSVPTNTNNMGIHRFQARALLRGDHSSRAKVLRPMTLPSPVERGGQAFCPIPRQRVRALTESLPRETLAELNGAPYGTSSRLRDQHAV